VGGLPEVIAHGETGFLRSVGDVAGLAEDGVSLLLDEPRYAAMSRASRERATRLFDANAIVSRYLAVYERVLAAA
jgi:glycosyltransferase involved in cell wall biosynthesis